MKQAWKFENTVGRNNLMEPYDCRPVARPRKQSVDAHNFYSCSCNAEAPDFISSLP
jgi:hypothetical protein